MIKLKAQIFISLTLDSSALESVALSCETLTNTFIQAVKRD